jgi:poly-gamma-glutamate synthesis protein (capsule biosynthesis protein)
VIRTVICGGLICVLTIGAAFLASVKPRVVTIVAVGDIMLSRNVSAKMRAAADPRLPFRNVAGLLDSSDFNFGNLESPFAPPGESDWKGVIGGRSLIFGAPRKALEGLTRFNFRVLSLANNHAMDQEEEGLAHTLNLLAANGIQAVGAGANLDEAWRARIIGPKGREVGFLAASYASLNYGTDERNEYVARIEDLDLLRSRVRALRSQVRYIIVAMHAGSEYVFEPANSQVEFAHAAIEAGADLVIGSHSHTLQPCERYKGGLIFYSLGNFVFDLDSPATREGAAVKIVFDESGAIGLEVFPIEIEDSCCPRPARPDEVPGALRRMGLRSTRIPRSRRRWAADR